MTTAETGTARKNLQHYLPWFLLAVCIILHLALRLRWVNHLLVWDEAMNVCTVRAFYSGGGDFSANWFWRHPPLFPTLMLLLAPLKTGFVQRTATMSVLISVVNLLLLFRLVNKVRGRTAAIWAVFFLAVMPGSAFFDVWIKRDLLATTFGLLALNLGVSGRFMFSGLSLGVALLAKETAVFYVAAVVLLRIFDNRRGRIGDLAMLILVPLLTAGWWYALVARTADGSESAGFTGLLEHFRFAANRKSGWENPWNYYFVKLPLTLGPLGMGLALTGVLVLAAFRNQQQGGAPADGSSPAVLRLYSLWPVFLLVPAYLLLSMLTSKVPWVIIVLLPAWAALQGMSVSWFTSFLSKHESQIQIDRPILWLLRGIRITILGLVLFGALFYVIRHNYEDMLRAMDKGQWRGATRSREAAQAINRYVDNNDRLLVTSFHYWQGLSPGHPCPVFACYLTKKPSIVFRSHHTGFDELRDDIITYEIDWALLSPPWGEKEDEIFGGFINKLKLQPHRLEGAFLFQTDSLHTNDYTGVKDVQQP